MSDTEVDVTATTDQTNLQHSDQTSNSKAAKRHNKKHFHFSALPKQHSTFSSKLPAGDFILNKGKDLRNIYNNNKSKQKC